MTIYAVDTGRTSDTSAAFGAIAEATGGHLVDPRVGTVAEQVREALVGAGHAPEARVTATFARAGRAASISAAGTFAHPDDPVVTYEWNLGTGTPLGAFDATTTEPRITHVYAEPGEYPITMRARTASGLAGVATDVLVVDPPFTRIPHVPSEVVVTAGDGELDVTWAPDDQAYWFTFLDEHHEVIESFSWFEPEWTLLDVPDDVPFTFYLTAGNDLGTSEPAGPFTVTPTSQAEEGAAPDHAPGTDGRPSNADPPITADTGAADDDGGTGPIDTGSPTGLAATGGAVLALLLVAAACVAVGAVAAGRVRPRSVR